MVTFKGVSNVLFKISYFLGHPSGHDVINAHPVLRIQFVLWNAVTTPLILLFISLSQGLNSISVVHEANRPFRLSHDT